MVDELPGRAIVLGAWVGDLAFTVVAVPAALGADAFDRPAIVVSLALFGCSLPIWAYAFGLAVVRSARGDDVVVASLFLMQGSAPRRVMVHLYAALVLCVVVAGVTAPSNPFGVLVPMLPLGLMGCWSARHGTFPPRRAARRT